MDKNQNNRRSFLKKLGAALAVSITGSVINTKAANFKTLNRKQMDFLHHYENWITEFTEVIEVQKINPKHIENNRKMIALSEEAENWKSELQEYLTNAKFTKKYLAISENMTKQIS